MVPANRLLYALSRPLARTASAGAPSKGASAQSNGTPCLRSAAACSLPKGTR